MGTSYEVQQVTRNNLTVCVNGINETVHYTLVHDCNARFEVTLDKSDVARIYARADCDMPRYRRVEFELQLMGAAERHWSYSRGPSMAQARAYQTADGGSVMLSPRIQSIDHVFAADRLWKCTNEQQSVLLGQVVRRQLNKAGRMVLVLERTVQLFPNQYTNRLTQHAFERLTICKQSMESCPCK